MQLDYRISSLKQSETIHPLARARVHDAKCCRQQALAVKNYGCFVGPSLIRFSSCLVLILIRLRLLFPPNTIVRRKVRCVR
jgi:hypothetical protein